MRESRTSGFCEGRTPARSASTRPIHNETRWLAVVVEKYFVTEDNQKVIIMLENISIKEMDGTVRF